MNKAQVEALLRETARFFDRTLEVHQNPTPFSFKLKPHLRPYFIEASREIIDEGDHREATYWILAGMSIGYFALRIDASNEEMLSWQSIWDGAMQDFGFDQRGSWPSRYQSAKALSDRVFQVADKIIADNSDIIG